MKCALVSKLRVYPINRKIESQPNTKILKMIGSHVELGKYRIFFDKDCDLVIFHMKKEIFYSTGTLGSCVVET